MTNDKTRIQTNTVANWHREDGGREEAANKTAKGSRGIAMRHMCIHA